MAFMESTSPQLVEDVEQKELLQKRRKLKSVTEPKSRLGTYEEGWLEDKLKLSYDKSASGSGGRGAALGLSGSPSPRKVSGGGGGPATGIVSALDLFGISRLELSKIGLGERKAQDRLYRTLTIWSGSLYESLHGLANGNKEVATRLWGVYTRLVEICNPETSNLVNVQLRHEFEEKLRTLGEEAASSAYTAKSDYAQLKKRLAEVEKAHDVSRGTAEIEVPRLRAELLAVREGSALVEEELKREIASSKEKSGVMQALRVELDQYQSQIVPLKAEVKNLHEQLQLSNQEIQRYIDMYLEADRIVRKNENTVTLATGEKERLIVKIAGLMKQSEDKDKKIEDMRKKGLDKQDELDALHASLEEAKEETELAARNLHSFVSQARNAQAANAEQVVELQTSLKSLNSQLVERNKDLLKSNQTLNAQGVRSVATEAVSSIWQQKYVEEKQGLEKQRRISDHLKGKLKSSTMEVACIQDIVTEKDQMITELRLFEVKCAELKEDLKLVTIERDAARLEFALTNTVEMKAQVKAMTSEVLVLQKTIEEQSMETMMQKKELGVLRSDVRKKDTAISAGNLLGVTLISVLACLKEELSAQQKVLVEAANAVEKKTAIPRMTAEPSENLRKKVESPGAFDKILNAEEKYLAMETMKSCIASRKVLVSILSAADQLPSLEKSLLERDANLKSMKTWAGNERNRNSVVLDTIQQKAALELLTLREEIKALEMDNAKLARTHEAMNVERLELLCKMNYLQEFYDANHEPEPLVEEKDEIEESDNIDFSQFDSDNDDEKVELRAPIAPEACPPSKSRTNPRTRLLQGED